MDLDRLKFIVETKQLENTITLLDTLTSKVQDLSKVQKESTSAENASTEASIANSKAKKAEFEALEAQSKALSAEIDLKRKQEKQNKATAESQEVLNKVQEESVPAIDKASSSAEKLVKRQELIAKYLGEELTRGAASTMASFKLLGTGTDDLEERLKKALETITNLGKNPFDSNIGALKSINHEFESLTNRANLLTAGISLNSKQLFEYSRIAQEISARLSSAGIDIKSIQGQELFNKTLKDSQAAYLDAAAKVNILTAAEKERNTALKLQEKEDARRAKEFLTYNDQAVVLFKKNEEEKANAAIRAAQGIIDANKNIQDSIERTNAIMAMVRNGISQSEATQRFDLSARGVDKASIDTYINKTKELAQVEKERRELEVTGNTILTKAERERESARKRLLNEEEKMVSVLHTLNDAEGNVYKSTERSARSIANYEKNLRQAGITGDEYAAKLAKYRQQQEELTSVEQKRQVNFLQRGLQPQIGDIAVSLASGQRPLTVLLQQGDQIRGLIVQTGLEGEALKKAFEGAMSGVVQSIKTTSGAVLSLLGGALTSVANTVKGVFVGSINLAISSIKDAINGTATAEKTLESLKAALLSFSKFGIVAAVAAVATLAYEAYRLMSISTELSKALTLTGASLGLSKDSAIAYAQSLNSIGITTSKGIEVITEMAKVGVLGADSIQMVSKAAIDLEKYGGVAIKDTVAEFVKLKEKPLEALTEVAKATGLINPEILAVVRSLELQGERAKAAKLAMEAYAGASESAAKTLEENLSPVERAFKKLRDNIKESYDSFTNLVISAPEKSEGFVEFVDKIANKFQFISVIVDKISGMSTKDIIAKHNLGEKVKPEGGWAPSDADIARNAALTKAQEDYFALQDRYQSKDQQRAKDINEIVQKTMQYYRLRYTGETEYQTAQRANLDITKAIAAYNERNKPSSGTSYKPFNIDASNEAANISKQYKSDLALVKQSTDDAGKILKNQYEERQIQRQEFVSADLQLLKVSNAKQLNLTEEYEKNQREIFVSSIQKAVQERNRALASVPDDKEGPSRIKEINDKYNTYVQNLGNSYASTTNEIDNFRQALQSTYSEKESAALKAFSEDTRANEEASRKFFQSRLEVIEARKIESDLQDQMAGQSDAEIARLTAMAKAQKEYANEIIRTNAVLAKANAAFEAALNDPNATDKQIEAANDARKKAANVVEQTIAQSRVDIQNEGTAAILKYYKDESLKFQSDLADNITQSIISGGKGGAKKFRDLIVAELSKPVTVVVRATVQTLLGGVSGGIQNLLGIGGNSGGTSVGNLASIGQGVSSAYKLVSGGLNVASSLGGYVNDIGTQLYKLGAQGVGNAIGQFGVGLSNGTASLGGFSQAFQSSGAELAGAIAGSVLNGFSGYGISKFISGGYKTGLFGSSLDKIGGIASAIPGIGPIAGLITGSINRLFGRKLKEVGIEGTFGGDQGFVGNNYRYYKGGLFASNKTKRSPLDEATRVAFADRYSILEDSARLLGTSLGQDVTGLDSFQYKMKLNFKGKSQDQINKLIEDTFSTISNKLADVVLGTTQYKKANETSTETLTRLSSNLLGFNKVLDSLGISAFKASLANADLAGKIIDAAGGLSQFGSLTSNFYSNYFTTSQKTALVTKNLTEEFAKLGVTSLPKTREEFRKLVSGLDLTTEQGQKSFLSFLALGDSLSSILPPLEDAQAAADELRNAFQSLTDGIFGEVKRIRDLLSEGTPNSFAQAQSDFAIATAQARAGDQTAAGNLPELSQALLGLAENQATSSVDLKRIQNQVLLSLEGTGQYLSSKYGTTIPGFEKGYGAGLTLTDTLALPTVAPVPASMSSTGTAVVTAGTSGTLANNSRLEDLVQVLQQSVENLRAEVRADVAANVKTANILTRVNQDGESLQTTVV